MLEPTRRLPVPRMRVAEINSDGAYDASRSLRVLNR